MPLSARFAHTNIVAHDWRRLANFYENVFGCVPMPPERNHHGPWVDKLTMIEGAHVTGIHLRLPGHGDNGPTLELFDYNVTVSAEEPALNRPGLAHLAFEVEDVKEARQVVLGAGGSDLGELVTVPIPQAGTITLIYMRDPEGNIIELQRWSD